MADKTLKARVKLLYKTLAEWDAIKSTFVPLEGELCIIEAPGVANPAILVKVGNGTDVFENLPLIQAVASDVYGWAKKEYLDFNDLSEDFKSALSSYVGAGNEYRLNKSGEVYTLQSREYDATTGTWGDWTDVADSSIDLSNKTDKVLNGANGKALMFNENDGGGAKFEHNDGTNSFVGVNDGGANGIAGQIYAVNKDTKVGARINITANGMFYTNGKNTYTYDANDELATKGDVDEAVADLGAALHYIGMTNKTTGEDDADALARIVADYQTAHPGYVLKAGAVAIVDAVEFIFDDTNWQIFGDEGLYATKTDLEATKVALKALIDAEEEARIAADANLQTQINNRTVQDLEGPNGLARIWNESDGGGVQFTHNDGTRSFTGVNDGGKDGITGQLYSVDTKNGNLGTRLNMTNNGFFYTNGKTSATAYTADDELATKGDIANALGDILIIDGNV